MIRHVEPTRQRDRDILAGLVTMDDVEQIRFLRPYIRRLIDALLELDAELDAFCIDYFPQIYKNFSNGMQRLQKVNALIISGDLEDIVNNLAHYSPRRFQSTYDSVIRSMKPQNQPNIRKSMIIDDIQDFNRSANNPQNNNALDKPDDLFEPLKKKSAQLLASLPMAPRTDLFGTLPVQDGPVMYRIANGTFRASAVEIIENGCEDEYSKHLLPGYSVSVQNDAQGNITISSSDGKSILGSGAVRYNQGVLTAENCRFGNENETWTSRRIVRFEAIGDNQFRMDVTDYRSNRIKTNLFKRKFTDCMIRFIATMKM